MNVSTRSEYGLRALIYLAVHQEGRVIPAREIADRWKVPIKYLEQILKTLKEARIIEGHVGLGGGYRLTRPAATITAGEVIRALDGRIAPMGCVSTYDYDPCEFESACGLRSLWAKTRAAMLSVLDQTTIADLAVTPNPQTVVKLKSVSNL